MSPTNLAKERKVLHISRADLEDVDPVKELQVAWIHHFRHNLKAVFVSRVDQPLEPLFPQTLKAVRRCTWLEGTTAQDVHPNLA